MAHVPVSPLNARDLSDTAERRWAGILEQHPDLEPALTLQRRLLTLVIEVSESIAGGKLPRLSLPPKYVAAKLARGVPALAAEPIPGPVAALAPALLRLWDELRAGGGGLAAEHIHDAIANGQIEPASLLTAS